MVCYAFVCTREWQRETSYEVDDEHRLGKLPMPHGIAVSGLGPWCYAGRGAFNIQVPALGPSRHRQAIRAHEPYRVLLGAGVMYHQDHRGDPSGAAGSSYGRA